MIRYSCDFETTVDIDDCRVWAWIAIDIDNTEERYFGNSIESFMDFIMQDKCIAYFHNLKFDGEFIISWLLKNDYKWVEKTTEINTFTTLISDTGVFYTMGIKTERGNIQFRDSLKLLNFSVDKIAKDFKLAISKLKIDYKAFREKGHELTKEEKDYIINDALIVAQALKILIDEGFTKITIGSNAFNWYQNQIGGKEKFRKLFPVLEEDNIIRKSYKGGFTYCAPRFQEYEQGNGLVYDVNSLYPYALHSPHMYPYGKPVYFIGKYERCDTYPLYVQRIICSFKIKPKHIPTIQLKNNSSFIPTQYIEDSGDEDIELTLTNVDLDLFFEQYEVINLRYVDGYKFKASSGLFDDYIDYWIEKKTEAKKENNPSRYIISKLMLNSLYGKFATKPNRASKEPYLKDDGSVAYKLLEEKYCEPIYIPVASFCTAYARDVTIRAAQQLYDRFLYADTDSLHILGLEQPTNIKIDPYELGAFKLEGIFDKAKYLKAKLYMEHIREPNEEKGTEQWKVTGAGMTNDVKKQVSFEDFKIGWTSNNGKLRPKHCNGGIVLVDTNFSIR